MTPTEKARDMICKDCVCERVCTKEEYQTPCKKYATAMQMHEWTKQQLIDKLEDWLANNICNAYNFRGDNISSTFINDCIKAMKGE